MLKLFLIFFITFAGIKFVFPFPTQEYVNSNNPENTEQLKRDDETYLQNDFYQGDMDLTPEQIALLSGKGDKTVRFDERYRWTNNIVPYLINENIYTAAQINTIHQGVQRIMDISCIRFVKYNPSVHSNYIYVTDEGAGCSSNVGMIGGRQRLNLAAPGCIYTYIVAHEFLHALGFHHMQSATERDDYVEILYENIEIGKEGNFNRYESNVISQFGVPYDYASVMHYGPYTFSKNNLPTIRARRTGAEEMGQRTRLSDKDIARLNARFC